MSTEEKTPSTVPAHERAKDTSEKAADTEVQASRLEVEVTDRESQHALTEERWDGGPAAWGTVIGGWLAMAATFGFNNAFGVFQDFYRTQDTASASLISWIGSTQLYLLIALGFISGKLVDTGYFRHTVFFGSLLYVFSIFMLSLASPHHYYQLFLSQGLGMGLGAGMIYVPLFTVQLHHWRVRHSLAIGIIVTGSAIAGICFPIMLNQLLPRVGFGWAVRAAAFIVLGCLTAANLLMRARPRARSNADMPQVRVLELLRDGPYMLVTLGLFLSVGGVIFPYFYIQVYARTHNVDTTVAFYTLAILNAASIPGRILPGLLTRKFGSLNVYLGCVVAYAALIFGLLGIESVAAIVVFGILAGVLTGSLLTLLPIVGALLSRHHGEAGLRIGLCFALAGLGALASTPIDGVLLGTSFTWSRVIIFNGVLEVAAACVLVLVRGVLVRRKGTWCV